MHVVWEHEVLRPVDDLVVGVVCGFGAEGWVPDQALEHDGTKRPPVALVTVSLLQEDLWSNVIRRTNGGICLQIKWVMF